MDTTFDDIKSRVGENILNRIQKLLSLATSDNENESAEAMNKAMTLLAQHQLSMGDITLLGEQEEAIDSEHLRTKTKTFTTWRGKLIMAIADSHFCHVYQSKYGDGVHYILTGRPTNRTAAMMLYRALEASIELGAHKARAEYDGWGSTKSYLNSYRLGMTDTICRRLNAERRKVESEVKGPGTDLVCVNPYKKAHKENLDYLSGKVKLRTATRANSVGDYSGYSRGRRDGEAVHLKAHRAIAG